MKDICSSSSSGKPSRRKSSIPWYLTPLQPTNRALLSSRILCIRHPEILLQEVASSPYIQEYKGIGSPYSYEKKYRDLCHWEKYQRRKARAKRKGKPLPEEARVPELGHQPEPDPRDYRMRTGYAQIYLLLSPGRYLEQPVADTLI